MDLQQKGMRHDSGARERVDGHVLSFSPENSVEKKREFRRGEARRTFYSHMKYVYVHMYTRLLSKTFQRKTYF